MAKKQKVHLPSEEVPVARPSKPLTQSLRLPEGPVDMTQLDPRRTPGYPGVGKVDAEAHTEVLGPKLSDLQERLFAEGRSNPQRAQRVLVVLQGMDTCGKGGVIRHAIGLVDPQGVRVKAFKAPTQEELAHDFLWRIEAALPGPGIIGIFDRSHYEDVLVARVNQLASPGTIASRYEQINRFEQSLVDEGFALVKCFLRISPEKQLERLNKRLDDPAKYWKYNPGDVDSRNKWAEYEQAYALALEHCNTDAAPWYVVPSDRKWYRNWAVAQLLMETLERMDPQWPAADFDVEAERARLNKQA